MRKQLIPLLALLLLIVYPAAAQDDSGLQPGVPVSGEITPLTDRINYTFDGQAGQTVYVTAIGDDPQLALQVGLFDSDQSVLAESLDFGPTALLGPYTLPETATYFVSVARPDYSDMLGAFQVMVDVAEVTPAADSLDFDQALPNQINFFSLSATEGDILRLGLRGPMLQFALIPPSGENAIYDGIYDDLGLVAFQAPQTGMYQLFVQSFAPDVDTLSLRLSLLEPPTLTTDAPVSGTVTPDEPALVAFESQAGKTWRIDATVAEGTGAGYLEILRLEGRPYWDTVLATDATSGPNGNPRIMAFTAPEDGTYYALVYYNLDDPNRPDAPYTVTLTASSLVNLVPDIETTGTITPETGRAVYNYAGKAGQVLRITISRTTETGSLVLEVRSPNDEVINFLGRGVASATFEVTLPVDGSYSFVIDDRDYNRVELGFSILLELIQS